MFADLGPAAIHHPLLKQFRPSATVEDNLLCYRMSGLIPPKSNRLSLRLWLKCYEKLFRFYLSEQGPPDLLHAHGFLAGYIAAHLKRKYHIPYVLTEHNSAFINPTFTAFQKRIIIQSFDFANQLIAVSEGLKNEMQKYTARNIAVVPNLVDTTLFQPQKKTTLKGAFRFMFIGSLIDRKNPLLLLEAFHQLLRKNNQQMTLSYVGDGALFPSLKDQISQLKLNDKVTLYGDKSLPEIARILTTADALIIPSQAETFGVVAIEAMACGLPVIATQCGGPEHVIEENSGILIPPNDLSKLRDAMEYLYLNYEEYHKESIRSTVLSKYSGPVVANQIIKIYRKI